MITNIDIRQIAAAARRLRRGPSPVFFFLLLDRFFFSGIAFLAFFKR
jgi:hypothetical protein